MKFVDLSKVVLVMACRDGTPSDATSRSIAAVGTLQRLGQDYMSDVTLARACSLTMAVEHERSHEWETIWMVDDDTKFPPTTALKIITMSQETNRPVTAVYMKANGNPALMPWPKVLKGELGPQGQSLWLAGLGMFAFPMQMLRDLKKTMRSVGLNNTTRVYPFCTSGPDYTLDQWVSEDFSLSLNLGGALLAPVPCGHRKMKTLWPGDSVLLELASKVYDESKFKPEA